MSADNWRVCPRCKAKAEAKLLAAKKKAEEAYGKVPLRTYTELLQKANVEPQSNETLREDFSLGISPTGEFWVSYTARCTACSLVYSHRHNEMLDVQGKKEASQ